MAPPTATPAIAPVARCVLLTVLLSLEVDEVGKVPLRELLAEEVPSDVVATPDDVGVEFALLVEAPVGTLLDAVAVASPIWLTC